MPQALGSGGFLYELQLDAPLLVPVRLRFVYFEVGSDQSSTSTTQDSYINSMVIQHVASEDEVPFDKFRVKIALVYTENGREDLVGPFFSDGREYSELYITA